MKNGWAELQKANVLSDPFPTPLESPVSPLRPIEGYRNLVCRHYDRCLGEAVKLEWPGWACTRCPLFGARGEAPRLRAERFAQDRRRE